MTDAEKCARYDDIVFSSRHYFEAWRAEHRLALKNSQQLDLEPIMRRTFTMDAQKYASMAHEHFSVLKAAAVEDLPVCDCCYCQFSAELINESPERQREEANS